MILEKIVPHTFLYYYSLKIGAFVTGIIMISIFVLSITITAIQAMNFDQCNGCPVSVRQNAHALCISAVVYSVFLLLMNCWFLWGVKRGKGSVVLGWIVVSLLWLIKTFTILVVLLHLYGYTAKSVPWTLSIIFAVIAMAILIYLWFIGLGYWVELKRAKAQENPFQALAAAL